MIESIEKLIFLFKFYFERMTQFQQMMTFIAILIPIGLLLYILNIFVMRHRRKKRIQFFHRVCKKRKLSSKEIFFIENLLIKLNLPLLTGYITQPFKFWKILTIFSHQAIEHNYDTFKTIKVINRIKSLGKRLFHDIPSQYYTTFDIPSKIDVTFEILEVTKIMEGYMVANETQELILQSRELSYIPPIIEPGQKVEISIIIPNKGTYTILTTIKDYDINNKNQLILEHTYHIIFKNMRHYDRYKLNIPVQLQFKPNQPQLDAELLDISLGGAKILSPSLLSSGVECILRMDYNYNHISLNSLILSSSKSKTKIYHIKFSHLDDEQKYDLKELIRDLKLQKTQI